MLRRNRQMLLKSLLIVASLAATTSACANDFRAMNFGDLCLGIADFERPAGSTGVAQDGNFLQLFNGTFEGDPVEIYYYCPKGRFSRGVYMWRVWSIPEVEALAGRLRASLISTYGQPDFEVAKADPLLNSQLKFEAVEKLSASWNSDATRISLNVSGRFAKGYWTVSIGYGDRRQP